MTVTNERNEHRYDRDVVIVGGGPAGCSAGVFCAREGLDTVIFDRGRSSIQRCAHLENFLGFPAGIDIETFYDLIHEHAETAGCEIVPDLVESVGNTDGGEGFRVTPQDGDSVTTRRVVAATRYDGEYMRGIDDDEAMFETYEHDGVEYEQFDREYADRDGTTPVEGLYVASPSEEADTQAIMAAGRGARVAHRVIAENEHVAMGVTLSGTHRGTFVGVEPTEESFEIDHAIFVRFADDEIVELWDQLDVFEFLRQLGVSEDPTG